MEDLANKKCIPCEGGIPAFDIKEIHKYLKKLMAGTFSRTNIITISLKKTLNLRILLEVKNLLKKLEE